ncbi:RING/U-box superfamily protein [Forsythia ovata]|uniref:RING/U-box superfamily protein n=1 Tax=Forsythia ovata TaxID=205694 RepID=A0ABD1PJ35_9LAMI
MALQDHMQSTYMPLNVDLNLPASSDDVDANLEPPLPYEPPTASQEPARDQEINKSTRRRRLIQYEEADGSQRGQSTSSGASGSRRRKVSHGQRSDGGEGDDLDENQGSQSAPQPRFPIFSCPICMEEITGETSTKCGHIFCRICIFSAIVAQGKCPTCRKKLTAKDTFRIYFPRNE